MNYIDELVKVSNDELKFSEQLLIIKEDISKSNNVYKTINSFIKDLNNYCELKMTKSHSLNSDYVLLNTNDFCMFILNRLITKIKADYDIKDEVMKRLLHVNTLDKWTKEKIKNQFIDTMFLIMTNAFTETTAYNFEKIDNNDEDLFEIYNIFLKEMKLDIIYSITKTKPLIFVGREGNQSACLTGLNILLIKSQDMIKYKGDDLDVMHLYGKLINNLTEITINLLFNDILNEYNISNLCEKYKIEQDDLSFTIGRKIADYISGNIKEESSLLKDIITISNENLSKESRIERSQFRIMHDTNKEFNEKFKDVFNDILN